MDPKTLIENFADEAARRSGLPEPERTEARHELVSHIYEKARALAQAEEPTSEHAKQTIKALGTRIDVHRAFFSGYTFAHPSAGWGRRTSAFAVDIIVMMVITTFILGFFVGPLENCNDVDAQICIIMNVPGPLSIKLAEDNPENDAFHAAFTHGLHSYVSSAAFLAYFVILEASWGRTVGKHAFGIHVLSENGPLPSFLQTLGRNLTKLVFPLLFLDWLLGWASSGGKKQRISDKLVKTAVAQS